MLEIILKNTLEVSCKKVVLKILAKFTEKHRYQYLFYDKVALFSEVVGRRCPSK